MAVVHRRSVLGWIAGVGLTSSAQAREPKFPNRPIKLIVPFSAGGDPDVVARLLQPKLGELLGATLVVENRNGASGMLGSQHVARSPADGYTLMVGTAGSHAINAAVFKQPGYHPLADFEPIAILGGTPVGIYANNNLPKDPKALFAALKRDPGKYKHGGARYGVSHLAMAKIKKVGGLDMLFVPYKTNPQAVQEASTGLVDLFVGGLGSARAYVEAGKLHQVAVLEPARLGFLPDVLTISELGFDGCDAASWIGLFAPKGTPREILVRLHAAVRDILRDPAIVASLTKTGLVVGGAGAPATLEGNRTFMDQELAKWDEAFRLTGEEKT